jgi:hypothetical protein
MDEIEADVAAWWSGMKGWLQANKGWLSFVMAAFLSGLAL